jgi:DNA-directed RNA polymerase specialized sigma24 family protein
MRNVWISNCRCGLRRPTETLVAIDSAYEAAFASPTSRQAAPSAEHQALSHEIDADIVEALLTLPMSMRETVYFIGIEGLNCREVAEIMGIARRSAAYRIHESRKQLRDKLAHYGRPQQPPPKPRSDAQADDQTARCIPMQ